MPSYCTFLFDDFFKNNSKCLWTIDEASVFSSSFLFPPNRVDITKDVEFRIKLKGGGLQNIDFLNFVTGDSSLNEVAARNKTKTMLTVETIVADWIFFNPFLCLQEIEKDEGIYVLTDKNYDEGVKQFQYLLVYFYAPWCGHCKAFGPELVKAGQQLKEKNSPIKFAKVNGPEEEELLKKMHVNGYPTLFFYRDGEPIPYGGGRMASEMVEWVEKKIGPPATVLEKAENVKEFIDNNDVVIVGFFSDPESEAAKQYKEAVRDYEEYPCAITADMEAAKNHDVSTIFSSANQICVRQNCKQTLYRISQSNLGPSSNKLFDELEFYVKSPHVMRSLTVSPFHLTIFFFKYIFRSRMEKLYCSRISMTGVLSTLEPLAKMLF